MNAKWKSIECQMNDKYAKWMINECQISIEGNDYNIITITIYKKIYNL